LDILFKKVQNHIFFSELTSHFHPSHSLRFYPFGRMVILPHLTTQSEVQARPRNW